MEKIKQIVFDMVGMDLSLNKGEIKYDTDLTLYGLDSINLILLIVEFEERFKISIHDEKLTLDNFSSIEKMYRTVKGSK